MACARVDVSPLTSCFSVLFIKSKLDGIKRYGLGLNGLVISTLVVLGHSKDIAIGKILYFE